MERTIFELKLHSTYLEIKTRRSKNLLYFLKLCVKSNPDKQIETRGVIVRWVCRIMASICITALSQIKQFLWKCISEEIDSLFSNWQCWLRFLCIRLFVWLMLRLPIWNGKIDLDLTRCLLLPCNCYFLALQSTAIVLCSLSSARQSLDVPYSSIALNLLQPPNGKSIESPKVSFNHVLRDFFTKSDKFLFRHVFHHFVLHLKVYQNLACSGAANSMNVLQRELNSFVVWNFHSSHTHTLYNQTCSLWKRCGSRKREGTVLGDGRCVADKGKRRKYRSC